ncbi:DHHW family protein [Pseudomonas sp. NPDC085632]|uniref:DHHW family protein n=1 Tax=Pseudomonas sp. NPDC085632 TaxID=3364429 RepID=UPI0037C6E3BF
MKRSVLIFLSSILLVLLCIPAINILTAPNKSAIKLTQKSFLYNMDFVAQWTSKVLYPFGISIDSKQVVIGKDDWLYLGDKYHETLSNNRRAPTDSDIVIAKRIVAATKSWNSYLADRGVKAFRIMIGPDKSSIYPEHLPAWAIPAPFNPTDALLAEAEPGRFIDLRPTLLAAKKTHSEDLYFRTDTHWNALGAGLAFQAFANVVGKASPEIKWPSAEAYGVTQVKKIHGGDLANFLRLAPSLSDSEPLLNVGNLPIKTKRIDFATQKVLFEGGNTEIGSTNKAFIVKSEGALNNKKVLWLRDSFGSSMSPLMAATFSEVLQLHWNVATGPDGNFTELVEKWKPDYVFFTVVERDFSSLWSSSLPVISVIPKNANFQVGSFASTAKANQLKSGPSVNEYEINGDDAYVDFSFSSKDARIGADYLNIDLTCSDGSPTVPLQLFWMENGQSYYDEAHSTRLLLRTGQSLINLKTVPKWPVGDDIKRVRVDVEALNKCTRFTLGNPSFGVQE